MQTNMLFKGNENSHLWHSSAKGHTCTIKDHENEVFWSHMIYEEQTSIQSKLENTCSLLNFPKCEEKVPLYLCVFLFLRSLFSSLPCSPSPVSSWSSFLYIRIQLIQGLASPSLSQASLRTTYSSTSKENPNGSRNCQVRGYINENGNSINLLNINLSSYTLMALIMMADRKWNE